MTRGPVIIASVAVLALRLPAGDFDAADRHGLQRSPDAEPSVVHAPLSERPRPVLAVRSFEAALLSDSLEVTDQPLDNQAVQLPAVWQAMLVRRDSAWVRALRLHYGAIVFDGHVDSPSRMLEDSLDFRRLHTVSEAHVDLPRMVAGGLDAAFFSIYVPASRGESTSAVTFADSLIREVRRQTAASDSMEIALTASDVRRVVSGGSKAILLGLEGGHALAGDPENISAFFREGIRYVTLTHVNTNSWADASQSAPKWNGLNSLGARMIEQMNRVGMIIDVSHVSDSTLFDVVSITNAPVIASHSSVRALADVPRNLSDDGLRAIASTGGVVLVNFFDRMLNPALNGEVAAAIYARVDSLYQGDLRDYWAASAGVYADYGLRPSSVADLAAHIDYVAQLVGPEHVGLGSDFDGMSSLPAGLHDVTRLPWITYELVRLGYTDEDIINILGGNVLRVMERVEEAARRSG